MARIHDITITSAGRMPTLGALLGTRITDVFDSINAQGYSSFFGAEFDNINQNFFNRHLAPMDRIGHEISNTVNMLLNPDRIRELTALEDFLSIPPCMEMSILMYEPVHRAFLEGRVDGWGYDPDSLPDEDIHGRILNNFYCEDVAAASDDDGYYDIQATIRSDDPDLSDDEILAIRRTREFIRERIMDGSDRDPTAIELTRG